MGKGKNGETCKQLIEAAIKRLGSPCHARELFEEVKNNWQGSEDAIWQHLMSLVVNLAPAYFHWRTREKFLFLREDGQYELYDPSKHGTYVDGTRVQPGIRL
jgi:hypothetical protein